MKNHIKVLHVTAVYPTEDNPHQGSFIGSQIESLRDGGIECDVYVLKGSGISKYIKEIRAVKKVLNRGEYQLVHAHYSYTGWTARLATRLPLVVSYMGGDVHGRCNPDGSYRFGTKLIHKLISSILAHFCQGGIAKSADILAKLPNSKMEVIPNGVNLEIFKPLGSAREELGLDSGKKYILFSSNPIESYRRYFKRFDLAENAVDLLKVNFPQAELIWIEGKSQSEVAKYLNSVDCLLLTSQHEGSPNILKEALACGLPVVATDAGDVVERLLDVDMALIVNRNTEEIADALYKLLKENRRSSNSREKISDLNINKIAKRIIDLYQRVLAKNSRKSTPGYSYE